MFGIFLSGLPLNACAPEVDSPDESFDEANLGDGTSNKARTGGYWWTQMDRSEVTEVFPDTGKVDPNDPKSSELRLGIAQGNGLDDDGSGNFAFHITGTVPAAPTVPISSTLKDPYWNATYGGLCFGGDCLEYKVPEARLGLGFRLNNKVLDELFPVSTGIVFRVKAGNNHGGVAQGNPRPLRVRAPMDLTDVPDPSFGDNFGTSFNEGAVDEYPTNEFDSNAPFCRFAGSLRSDGTSAVGDSEKTCFCHFQSPEVFVSTEWKTFCVAWSAMEAPACPGLANAPYPVGGITKVIPERLIKLHFDAYQPKSTEDAADFDLWFDDIRLVGESATTASWDKYCGPDSGATVL